MIGASIEERNAALRTQLEFMARLPREAGPPPGFKYASLYDYVLAEGRPAQEIPLTIEEARWFKQATRGIRYPIKECFSNSQRCLLGARELLPSGWTLEYVEGFVAPDWIPMAIHHGWLTLNGKLIDLTLRYHGRKTTRQDRFADRAVNGLFPGRAYFGVTLPAEMILAYIVKHKEWATLLDNYRDRHPLLRGEGANHVAA